MRGSIVMKKKMIFHFLTLRLLTAKSVLLSVLVAANAQARPTEPGRIDPVKDAAYVSKLGLSQNDWNDSIINILVVGQDARGGYHRASRYTRPSGETVAGLGSRADGNLVVSFNKTTGQVSTLVLYRGMIVPDSYWLGVEDAPPLADASQSERYLANFYLIAGRAKYLQFVQATLESFVIQKKLEAQYLTGGRLKIHGTLETGFDGFKSAMTQFVTYFSSSAKVAWAMKGHAGAFFEIYRNRDKLMTELVVRESEVTLTALRERHKYAAGGYQRSFNHATFISSVMGFFAYTMAEAEFTDILREPAIVNAFNVFSRSFDLATFDSRLRLADRNLHVLARTGFQKGVSPIYVIHLGSVPGTFALFQNGQLKVTPRAGSISQIDPKILLIPNANDCPKCLPK